MSQFISLAVLSSLLRRRAAAEGPARDACDEPGIERSDGGPSRDEPSSASRLRIAPLRDDG